MELGDLAWNSVTDAMALGNTGENAMDAMDPGYTDTKAAAINAVVEEIVAVRQNV